MSFASAPESSAARSGEAGSLRSLWILLIPASALLIAVSLAYVHDFKFVCRDALPALICGSLSLAVPRALIGAGLLGLLLAVQPDLRAGLRAAGRASPALPWTLLAAAGAALIFVPWLALWLRGALLPPGAMLAFWLGGLGALGIGLAFAAFVPRRLTTALAPHLWGLAVIAALGLLLPEIVLSGQDSWKLSALSDLTFASVVGVLDLLGQTVHVEPSEKIIGIGEFVVAVGPQCSGIEGLALITAFTGTFLWLFRDRLVLGRAIWLLPLGLLLSWMLNVLRISALLLIGRYVSADLAIEGFHSHAGWLLFVGLSLAMAFTATRLPWLLRAGPAHAGVPAGPVATAEAGGQILPFLAFMAVSAVLPAISAVPDTLYPVKFAVAAAALWLCRTAWLRLDWRLDPLSIGAGLAIGAGWLLLLPASGGAGPLELWLAAAPPALLALWVVCRVLGTAVVVPLVEELFFRGYLLSRIEAGTTVSRVLAVAVSSLLFGVLHGRIVEAALAGVIFALLVLRSGRLADAILSHAVANAVIAAWALWIGDWSVI